MCLREHPVGLEFASPRAVQQEQFRGDVDECIPENLLGREEGVVVVDEELVSEVDRRDAVREVRGEGAGLVDVTLDFEGLVVWLVHG